MKKKNKKSLLERKMADRQFREQFEKEYPLFELEVQKLKEGYIATRQEDKEINKEWEDATLEGWREELSSDEIVALEKIFQKQRGSKIMNAEEFKKCGQETENW